MVDKNSGSECQACDDTGTLDAIWSDGIKRPIECPHCLLAKLNKQIVQLEHEVTTLKEDLTSNELKLIYVKDEIAKQEDKNE